jgi:phosphopantothenoylcysteine synthetase/decarboxylase
MPAPGKDGVMPRPAVLYHLICAGPPAADAETFVRLAQAAGWDVCLIASPAAVSFVDAGRLATLTRHPVRSGYKAPDDPDVLPPASAMVVAPATFNTVNKVAAGIADTLVTSLICEYLGIGVPMVLAPNTNGALARHPAYRANLDRLRSWGATVVTRPSGQGDATDHGDGGDGGDGGDETAIMVEWATVLAALPVPAA